MRKFIAALLLTSGLLARADSIPTRPVPLVYSQNPTAAKLVHNALDPVTMPNHFTNLVGFGDSIMGEWYSMSGAPVNPSENTANQTNGYFLQVANSLSVSETNLAWPSMIEQDQQSNVFTRSINDREAYFYALGVNDYGRCSFVGGMQLQLAALAWMSFADTDKIKGNNLTGYGNALPASGSRWSNDVQLASDLHLQLPSSWCPGIWTHQAGDYIILTNVVGPSFVLGYLTFSNSAARPLYSQFNVWIDGNFYGTFANVQNQYSSAPLAPVLPYTNTYQESAMVFSGLTNGSHTVAITNLGIAGNSNYFAFEWVGAPGMRQSYPHAYDLELTVQTHGATLWDNGAFSNCCLLRSIYLPVTPIPLQGVVNPGTDIDTLSGGGLHPNYSGHAKIAAAIRRALRSSDTGNIATQPFNATGVNLFAGWGAGIANTTGSNDVFLGFYAGGSNTNGYSNVAIGWEAMYLNTLGADNIAIGDSAERGMNAGNYNVAIGVGSQQANNGKSGNTSVGHSSLHSVFANGNSAFGWEAMNSVGSGQYNSAIGYNIFDFLSTGSNNVGAGLNAGLNLTNGYNDIYLGANVGLGQKDETNKVRLGNPQSDTFYFAEQIAEIPLTFEVEGQAIGITGGNIYFPPTGYAGAVGSEAKAQVLFPPGVYGDYFQLNYATPTVSVGTNVFVVARSNGVSLGVIAQFSPTSVPVTLNVPFVFTNNVWSLFDFVITNNSSGSIASAYLNGTWSRRFP